MWMTAHPLLRRVLRAVLLLLLIPGAVVLGAVFPTRHVWISLSAACLSLWVFFTGVDERRVGTRRMVLSAVMIALAVVGRMLPMIKPTTAVVVLAGMYLGREAGFFVGAITALLSNFYFGQGPFTPFQMLALGLIGLAAGVLAPALTGRRWAVCLYGAAAGIAYSAVMDVWTVVWYNGGFSPALYAAAVVTALPHTALYAASNLLFLALLAKPFGEKLSRIKKKYGV